MVPIIAILVICAAVGLLVRFTDERYYPPVKTPPVKTDAWCDCELPTDTTVIGAAFPHKVEDHLD